MKKYIKILLILFVAIIYKSLGFAQDLELKMKKSSGVSGSTKIIAVSQEGDFWVIANNLSNPNNQWDNVNLWDVINQKVYQLNVKHPISASSFSPDGEIVATGTVKGEIKLWDLQGNELQTIQGHGSEIISISFTPDGQKFLSGSCGRELKLWNLSGELEKTFPVPDAYPCIYPIGFPNQNTALIGIKDGFAMTLDLKGNPIKRFGTHWFFSDISISNDGKGVLMVSNIGTEVWDIEKGFISTRLHPKNQSRIISAEYIPNGKNILTIENEGNINILDSNWNSIGGFQLDSIGKNRYGNLRMLPSGKHALTGANNSIAYLRELKTGKVIASLYNLAKKDEWAVVTPDGLFDGSEETISKFNYMSKFGAFSFPQIEKRYHIPGLLAKLIGLNRTTLPKIEPFSNQTISKMFPLIQAEIQDQLLHINLKDQGGGIGKVTLYIDGQEISTDINPQRLQKLKLDLGDIIAKPAPGQTVNIGIKTWNTEGWFSSDIHELSYRSKIASPKLVLQSGHSRSITSICFSPDGNMILTGSYDGTAKLWDISGRELRTFSGHTQGITSVAFSPNKRSILTGSHDGTAILWDLNGKKITTYSDFRSYVFSVAFSPDGTKVLIGSDSDYTRLWDLHGREIQAYKLGQDEYTFGSNYVAFSPDGAIILTHEYDGRIWDISGSKIGAFEGDFPVFSPDGKYLLGIIGDTVKISDMEGQVIRHFVSEEMKDISRAIFSPDGSQVLVGCDGGAKLWSIEGTELSSIKFNDSTQNAEAIAFSPNGQFILTAHSDGTAAYSHGIIMWDIKGRKVRAFNEKRIMPIGSVEFLNKDTQLKAQSAEDFYGALIDSEINFWDLSGRTLLSLPIQKNKAFLNERVSSQMNEKVSPDSSRRIKIVEDSIILMDGSRQLLSVLAGNNAYFFPDENGIVTYNKFSVDIWNFQGERMLYKEKPDLYFGSPQWPIDRISDISFSPDGRSIVLKLDTYLAMRDHLKVWDLESDTLYTIDHPTESISLRIINSIIDFCFAPNGDYILTGGTDNTVRLWDFKGNLIQSFIGHSGYVTTVAFSSDGKYILSGSEDGTVKLWESETGKLLLTFIALEGQNDRMIISGDGYYAISKNTSSFVGFTFDLTAYNFEQFDLRLNRPDKVLEALLPFGADSSLILQYRQAYYKRLEKHGFTEDMLSDAYHVPICKIQNNNAIPLSTSEPSLKLDIQATDSLRLLDRLNIFINDVPIYGIQGINLRDQNTQEYNTILEIPLSRGENKIQVSVLNQGGAESLKSTTYITYDAPEIKPDLHLITIGVSDYQAEGKDLQYAAKDAQDIATFYANASSFSNTYPYTLIDKQVTKENILALRKTLEQSQVDDQVLIYVSGHGLLDENYDFYYGTHDIDFTSPSEKGILYDDIESLLDGIPARKKLLLMDACHSGEYDADTSPMTKAQQDSLAAKGIIFKGFTKGNDESAPILGLQNSFEMMKQLFADLRRGSGATVISSSSGIQFSYEDNEWENGAFTYVLLNGLKTMKADVNGDGEITASEIQAYVGEYVPKLTEGLQVPTFRQENLEYDFRVW